MKVDGEILEDRGCRMHGEQGERKEQQVYARHVYKSPTKY